MRLMYAGSRMYLWQGENLFPIKTGCWVLQPEFELSTSDMIVQFSLRNLGVGCVVRDFAAEYLESGKLFELRFNKIIPKRSFCVVRSEKMPLSTAAGRLLEIMEK